MNRQAERDKKVKQLQAVVDKKSAEIKRADVPYAWKTTSTFAYEQGKSGGVHLAGVTNVEKLIDIVAFLLDKSTKYLEAARILGVPKKRTDFLWNGYTVDDWIKDCEARVNKIQLRKKKTELKQLEEKLSTLLSADAKADDDLAAIEALLGD